MTREEAIEYINQWLNDEYALNEKDRIVLNMANEALEQVTSYETTIVKLTQAISEQEPILDKIRAEIEHIIDYTPDSIDYDESLYNGAYRDGLYKALDIIDKYKAEGEKE